MTISIIAVSGSLRAKSTNTRLLQEIGNLIKSDISYTLYDSVEKLPQFNPDKENVMNAHTKNWVKQLRTADALIISSPEYAHGIPGALKNALDWAVGTDAFIEKPFCLYHACPRSEHAPKALLEVLKTMSGQHAIKSDVTVDLLRNYEASDSILAKNKNSTKILNSIKHLCSFIKESKKLAHQL